MGDALGLTISLVGVVGGLAFLIWFVDRMEDRSAEARARHAQQEREVEAREAAEPPTVTRMEVRPKPRGTITLIMREGVVTCATVTDVRLTQEQASGIRAKITEMLADPLPVIVVDGATWEVRVVG